MTWAVSTARPLRTSTASIVQCSLSRVVRCRGQPTTRELTVPCTKGKHLGPRSFRVAAPTDCNSLPRHLRILMTWMDNSFLSWRRICLCRPARQLVVLHSGRTSRHWPANFLAPTLDFHLMDDHTLLSANQANSAFYSFRVDKWVQWATVFTAVTIWWKLRR